MKKFKHKQTGKIVFLGGLHYHIEGKPSQFPLWMLENSNDWEEITEYPIGTKLLDFYKICPDIIKTEKGWQYITRNIDIPLNIKHEEIGEEKRFRIIKKEYKLHLITEDKYNKEIGEKVYKVYKQNNKWLLFSETPLTIAEDYPKPSLFQIYFHSLQAAKEWILQHNPVLITENGKEVYPNTSIWVVHQNQIMPFQSISHIVVRWPNNNMYKYFLTKQEAYDYLNWTRPIFSRKDLMDLNIFPTNPEIKKKYEDFVNSKLIKS